MKRQSEGAGECKPKVKKVRTSPTNTSLLPPCKVCKQQAAGFHYGVNTCEACKGFFRRSLIREEPYKCLGKGNCDIGAGKRKICPHCRYLKCLAVGMSRDNIKTGRYTHAKRTQDTLEYYQTLGTSLFHNGEDPLLLSTAASRSRAMDGLVDILLAEDCVDSTPTISATADEASHCGETWSVFDSGAQLCPLSPSSTDQLRKSIEDCPLEPPSLTKSVEDCPLQPPSLTESIEECPMEPVSFTPLPDLLGHSVPCMSQSDEENRNRTGLPSFASLCKLPQTRKHSAASSVSSSSSSDCLLNEEGNALTLPPFSSLHDPPVRQDSSQPEGREENWDIMTLPSLHDPPVRPDSSQPEDREENWNTMTLSSLHDPPVRPDISQPEDGEENWNTMTLPSFSSLNDPPEPHGSQCQDREEENGLAFSSTPCVVDELSDLTTCDGSASRDSEHLTACVGSASTDCDEHHEEAEQDVLDDVQCEKMVRHLLQAHSKLICSYDSLPPAVMRKKQMDCYENCKLKRDVFGPMDLSEREYQDIYKRTGLDADNRQPFIAHIMERIEENICCFIAFVKTIPGFSQLSTSDQLRLIRDNRSEFPILCNYWGFNDELKVVTFPQGITLCLHELSKVWGRDFFLCRFQCARLLQRLGLTHQEAVILKCLMVVTVGNQNVDEPEKVSAVQWKMAQCLMWTLKQSRRSPERLYARIISAMCQLRELCEKFYKWVKDNPFENYSQVQNNSLLAEWFSEDVKMT